MQINCVRFRSENCDYQWNWSGQKTGSSCGGLRSVKTNDKLGMAKARFLALIFFSFQITRTSLNTDVFGRSPEVRVNEVLLYAKLAVKLTGIWCTWLLHCCACCQAAAAAWTSPTVLPADVCRHRCWLDNNRWFISTPDSDRSALIKRWPPDECCNRSSGPLAGATGHNWGTAVPVWCGVYVDAYHGQKINSHIVN